MKILKVLFVAGLMINFITAGLADRLPQNLVLSGFAIGEILMAPAAIKFIILELKGER